MFNNNKILCACCVVCLTAQAQNVSVSGRIQSSENKKPLQSVNIVIPNLELGSTTDINGQFTINNLPLDNIELEISILGYRDTTLFLQIDNSLVNLGNILLDPEVLHFEEINVEVHSDLEPTSSLSSISMSGKKMQENMKGSVAQTLKNELGVAIQSMGQGTTRPILRGYSGDRFLITENGFETGDLSHTSVDHALSMDLGGVEEIEIIRGPRSLLFGSNTISGVVNVDKNSMPEVKFDHFHSYFTSAYNSGNKGFFNNISFIAPMNKNDFRFSFQTRKADNEMTPIGELKNTSLKNTEWFFGLRRYNDGRLSLIHI